MMRRASPSLSHCLCIFLPQLTVAGFGRKVRRTLVNRHRSNRDAFCSKPVLWVEAQFRSIAKSFEVGERDVRGAFMGCLRNPSGFARRKCFLQRGAHRHQRRPASGREIVFRIGVERSLPHALETPELGRHKSANVCDPGSSGRCCSIRRDKSRQRRVATLPGPAKTLARYASLAAARFIGHVHLAT